MRILFIGNTRLGDAILSTPILDFYCKKNNHITVICSTLSGEIYSSFSKVKTIIAVKKKKRGLHWLEVYLKLESIKWDLVIDLRNTIISRLIRKKKILRFKSQNKLQHKVKEYCNFIGLTTIKFPNIPKNNLHITEIKNLITKYRIKSPILAVAPFTNWKRKDWPLKNYKQLILKLLEKKYFSSVIILGSVDEKDDCYKLEKELRVNTVFNFAGLLKIKEIFELLKVCSFFIGNDSGLSHLAAASGIKTLTLFGPSKNEIYRPLGKNSHFIRTPETYSELVEVEGYDRLDKTSLMKGLKVEDVLFKFNDVMSNKN